MTFTDTLPIQRSARFRRTDGGLISAHDFGGEGDLLVIAHAAGFCGGAYAPVAATLRDRFNVWAIDLRGHGDSPAPADADFSWDGMAEDILTVVAGLDRDRTVLFGHSLGGGAGLRAEALAPGAFSAGYVYEPAVLPAVAGVDTASSEMGSLVRRRRTMFTSRTEAMTRLATRPPFDTMCAEALQAFALHGLREISDSRVELKCAPQNEALVYEASSKITVDQISTVSIPIMLGIGAGEKGLPALAAPLIRAALPHADIISYQGLGHMGPFENPAVVGADALAHLTDPPQRNGRPQ